MATLMKTCITKGYFSGIIAAICYGMNPLFALPVYAHGFSVNSVLFYRYLFATIIYGLLLRVFKHISLKITFKEFIVLLILGVIFAYTDIFIFEAFRYIDSGLACTMLFVYPLMVALISRLLFKEKMPSITWLALTLVIGGVCFLYNGKIGTTLSIRGIVYVFSGALSYAIYMISIEHVKIIKNIKQEKLIFYVMLFGLSVYMCNLRFFTELQPLNNWFSFACIFGLALFPTIISLKTITYAIKYIGATKTAILGALEPLTALFFGALLFNETITLKIIIGITLILTGVIFVIKRQSNEQ